MNSDKLLYNSFCKGDILAYEELVLRHRHSLVYFLLQYLKDYHNAEDIAQDVFAYIYLNPLNYSDKYEFKTYLIMLGKRRAIDFIRKNKKHNYVSTDDRDNQEYHSLEDIHSLEEIIYQRENTLSIKKALEEVKPEYRQVIVLIYINGLSLAETAAVMDKSVAAVKVLSLRAKNKLKKVLEKGGHVYEI